MKLSRFAGRDAMPILTLSLVFAGMGAVLGVLAAISLMTIPAPSFSLAAMIP